MTTLLKIKNTLGACALATSLVTLSGCVSIPSEAPELSQQLGEQIASIQTANLTLLQRYFDLKRDQVDQFVKDEWIPRFAENVFSNPKIEKVWLQIVSSGNKQDRLEFLLRTAPRLQSAIDQKRAELIQPLNELEATIREKIRREYELARATNNSITSFLISADEVAENRNRYLEKAGITGEQVSSAIDKVDGLVSELLTKTEKVQDKSDEYLEKIKELKEKLSK